MEERRLLSSVSWTGGAGDNNWDTANNWSGNAVPGSGDDVTINVASDIVHSQNVADSINSLTSIEPLTISGGTLSIAAASTINSTLTINGGMMSGTGAVTVGGLLTLTSGTISGSGAVNANGGILIDQGSTEFNLDGRTMINPVGQTTTVTASGFMESDGAVFENDGTFLAQSDTSFDQSCWRVVVVVVYQRWAFHGVGRCTGELKFYVPFKSAGGTLDVQTGELELLAGATNTSAEYTVESGAQIDIGGPSTFDAASSVTGAGTVEFFEQNSKTLAGTYNVTGSTIISGSINFTGTVSSIGTTLTVTGGTGSFGTAFSGSAGTIATVTVSGGEVDFGANALQATALTINGGTLSSSAAVTVSGLTSLDFGHLVGSGTLNADGGMIIDPDENYFFIDGTDITNAAGQTATWTGDNSTIVVLDGAVFTNLGAFQAESSGTYLYEGGAVCSFVTPGSFTRSSNAGEVDFTNGTPIIVAGGTFDVQSGTLGVRGGSTFSGATVTIESSATLDFSGVASAPSTLDSGTTISGAGNLTLEGGTSLTLAGNSDSFTGPTTVEGGTLRVDGSLTGSAIATDFLPSVVSDGLILVSGTGTVGTIATHGGYLGPGDKAPGF